LEEVQENNAAEKALHPIPDGFASGVEFVGTGKSGDTKEAAGRVREDQVVHEQLIVALVGIEEFLVEALDGEGLDDFLHARAVATGGEFLEAFGCGAPGFPRAEDVGEAARVRLAGRDLAGFVEGGFLANECETVGGFGGIEDAENAVRGAEVDLARDKIAQGDSVAADIDFSGDLDLEDGEVFSVLETDISELQKVADKFRRARLGFLRGFVDRDIREDLGEKGGPPGAVVGLLKGFLYHKKTRPNRAR
jgi:hypothetical protein